MRFRNHYACPACKNRWENEAEGSPEDNCTNCKTLAAPIRSEPLMFRNWYQCADCHPMQWTTETPKPVNSPCPQCGLLFFPWASEDMTTAKFKSDNGIPGAPHVDQSPQLDLFR